MFEKRNIPLMSPLLPDHTVITPYLETIDKNRRYSNFGPLVLSLEERLNEFYSSPPGSVVSLSSGTSGLVNTLRAFNPPKGSYCLVPSWTFVATAAAVIAAGLVPYFVDVAEENWALTPDIAKDTMTNINGTIGAIIVVSPFGAPITTSDWDEFTNNTDIPVIIDGAASFDAVSQVEQAAVGTTPIMISLHATKVCGCGEGGFIISKDINLVRKIRETSNFGFSGGRSIKIPGTNGKMSEYTAAVAHAALDQWPEKRKKWIEQKKNYLEALQSIENKVAHLWISEEWASATCNIRLKSDNADKVIQMLNQRGVESRQWWNKGCHTQPAYTEYPRTDLTITEKLAESVIALPFSVDMCKEDIQYVVSIIEEILDEPAVRESA